MSALDPFQPGELSIAYLPISRSKKDEIRHARENT